MTAPRPPRHPAKGRKASGMTSGQLRELAAARGRTADPDAVTVYERFTHGHEPASLPLTPEARIYVPSGHKTEATTVACTLTLAEYRAATRNT